MAHLEKIRNTPGVVGATPYYYFGGSYKDPSPQYMFAQFAVDPESLLQVIPEIEVVDPSSGAARPEYYEHFRKNQMGAIAGRELFKRFGWKVGDRIALEGVMTPAHLELSLEGAFKAEMGAESNLLYFHFNLMDEALGRPGATRVFMIRAASVGEMASVIDRIDSTFANSEHETHTETEQSMRGRALSLFGNIEFFIRSIGTAVAFTMLMVAANTTSMVARERTSEIATMRAIGFERSRVFKYLIFEATTIAMASAAFGVLLSQASVPVVRSLFLESIYARMMSRFRIDAGLSVGVLLIGAGVGCAAAIIPFWNSVRKPIVATIRQAA
jgi:putative ABC transport system permease protein